MRTAYDKKQIAQLLDKFMAGTTTLDEERTLVQYFRTQEEEAEWLPYKEMFALFDAGQVEVPPTPAAEKPRARVISPRWMLSGVAASLILLVGLYWVLNEPVSTPDQTTTILASQPSEVVTAPAQDSATTDSTPAPTTAPMPAPQPNRQPAKPLTKQPTTLLAAVKTQPAVNQPALAQQSPQRDETKEVDEPTLVEEKTVSPTDQQLIAEYIASNFMTLEERNLLGGDGAINLDQDLLQQQPDRTDPINGIGQIIQLDYD